MFDLLKRILKSPIRFFIHPGSVLYPNTWCNKAFVDYLRSKGAQIGENTRFISPANCNVDINRANYIKIGRNCCLSFVTLLAHDYSWFVLGESHNEILPDSGGQIEIGDNCFIGYQAVVLKNTKIGSNVIIGARSVVKGVLPSNTVWAGVPARQICTLDQFYEKKRSKRREDALYRRDVIRNTYNREPTINEMGLFSFLFLERSIDNYETYIKEIEFNGIRDNKQIKDLFFKSSPSFSSFEEFLNEKM